MDCRTERDKFLTEAMGECWHGWREPKPKYIGDARWPCTCGENHGDIDFNNDFSTWEGFGKLWEWVQKQEWWILFVDDNQTDEHGLETINGYLRRLINPDRFADAVYKFLKEK